MSAIRWLTKVNRPSGVPSRMPSAAVSTMVRYFSSLRRSASSFVTRSLMSRTAAMRTRRPCSSNTRPVTSTGKTLPSLRRCQRRGTVIVSPGVAPLVLSRVCSGSAERSRSVSCANSSAE